jgi:Flp pilus assembly pilin Flp
MDAINLFILRLMADRRGVTAIEYAVLAGAVVVGLIAIFGNAGTAGSIFGILKDKLTTIVNKIPTT